MVIHGYPWLSMVSGCSWMLMDVNGYRFLLLRCLVTVTEKVTSHHFPLNGEPVVSPVGAGNRVSQAHDNS